MTDHYDGRKVFTFEIEFDDGRAAKKVTFVQGRIKLKVLKLIQSAQKSGDWVDMIGALAAMLRISEEEADEIELDDWKALAAAMSEGANVPNESAPPTEPPS